eukprot:SAG11_NODE_5092_length_1666_cov_2.855775_3_plen_68_part_00
MKSEHVQLAQIQNRHANVYRLVERDRLLLHFDCREVLVVDDHHHHLEVVATGRPARVDEISTFIVGW